LRYYSVKISSSLKLVNLRQWFNYLQQSALLTSLVEYDKFLRKFGQQQLVMVNYTCGFNQSETGKYFELIIIIIIVHIGFELKISLLPVIILIEATCVAPENTCMSISPASIVTVFGLPLEFPVYLHTFPLKIWLLRPPQNF